MSEEAPTVSILITTFNRSRLLLRAINSVLMQDFDDFELVIIDDCSSDDTSQVVASCRDPRIRYIRNEINVGSKAGDRPHLRRFVYELMRGTYFIYLCDDDYWLYPDSLRRQVTALNIYNDAAMVIGGQLSYFLTTPESYLGRSPDNTLTFTLENIGDYFDLENLKSRSHHLYYMQMHLPDGTMSPLFPNVLMTSEEFLNDFSEEPTTKNLIVGATLFRRDLFVKAGVFSSPRGSQWQAGYEFLMAPACYGGVIYLNEPLIVTEIRSGNASFKRTQIAHYEDSIVSIETAFAVPLKSPDLHDKRKFLKLVRGRAIRNLSRAYLRNTLTIRRKENLALCSPENMAHPVTYRQVLSALARNNALGTLEMLDIKLLVASGLPDTLFEQFDKKHQSIRG